MKIYQHTKDQLQAVLRELVDEYAGGNPVLTKHQTVLAALEKLKPVDAAPLSATDKALISDVRESSRTNRVTHPLEVSKVITILMDAIAWERQMRLETAADLAAANDIIAALRRRSGG